LSRRLGAWVAFALSLAAVLAVAVAVQSYAEVFNRRVDLTQDSRLSLSPYTLSVLDQIEHPLRVELYYRRGERQRSLDLLELMRDHSPELSYELVDLDRNPGRAKDHGVEHYDRAVLFYQGRETVVSAGTEETLTGGIAKVLHEKPRVLYFVVGHRERKVAAGDDAQYGRAAQILRNEGFEIRTLSLLHQPGVPDDASAVIVAGPEVDLVEAEIAKLESYLARGGAVLVLVDPVELPQLTAWLAKHGLVLRDDVVIDRTNRVYGSDGTNAIVPFYRQHEATRAMDVPAVLGRARSVGLENEADDVDEKGVSVVARTANESFAASGAARTRQGEVEFDSARDRTGPIGVMAVAYAGPDEESAGRLVVVGDADFASDDFLPLLGNKDLLVNTIGWLVADRASGARPREQATQLGPVSPVYVSDEQSRVIFLTTVFAQPLLFLLAGTAVVLVRRRRR
jgi:ABC-type uncharacterized transport system involved in gliding motility auxiliary subunit